MCVCVCFATMESRNSGDKVQVLTAGGAANLGGGGNSKLSKRRNKKKNKKTKQKVDAAVVAAAAVIPGNYTDTPSSVATKEHQNENSEPGESSFVLELEHSECHEEDDPLTTTTAPDLNNQILSKPKEGEGEEDFKEEAVDPLKIEVYDENLHSRSSDFFWLFLCFIGIMFSFVAYGLLLEYTTSGGRKLHELSFLFVTSGLYTFTAAAGRYVRAETPTTIPPARFAVLGLTSMGSTFCSVRSLR